MIFLIVIGKMEENHHFWFHFGAKCEILVNQSPKIGESPTEI